ncbi:MAG: hypothetical protein OEY59_07085, partial [Deltaproteobacteria bacterium]|nr:hypothetical protein [Deltaproteobacteria bacterium]
MSLKYNEYYLISEGGEEAVNIANNLLQSFPLTRACLQILGQDLINKLEFGFFSAGKDIIQQGETGKDLFLLCQNSVDVLVNDQIIVQMESPALLGDKGIVEPHSTRAAT